METYRCRRRQIRVGIKDGEAGSLGMGIRRISEERKESRSGNWQGRERGGPAVVRGAWRSLRREYHLLSAWRLSG